MAPYRQQAAEGHVRRRGMNCCKTALGMAGAHGDWGSTLVILGHGTAVHLSPEPEESSVIATLQREVLRLGVGPNLLGWVVDGALQGSCNIGDGILFQGINWLWPPRVLVPAEHLRLAGKSAGVDL